MADILVVDDQDRTIALCERVMPEHRWLGPERNWADARAHLMRRGAPDLVLLDLHFDLPAEALLGVPAAPTPRDLRRAQREQGAEILAALRERWPDLPVVLMTARGEGLERMADRLHAQEYTYFLDDEDLDARALRAQVEGILQARRGREREGPIYWGRTLALRRIRQRLSVLARGRLPVLLGGPTGTGKSLIARHFVHPRSRRKGRFVAVDLSTLPRDLVAAQLFGAVRGAYTGSVSDRKGAFEEADGGTLFLDEIGNLGEDVQRMLLAVLQERVVTRVGDTRERPVDVKLVVATHEDLGELVKQGRFRADLYMRLNPAARVRLPPLEERRDDLRPLVRFVVERIGAEPHLVELVEEYRARVGLPTEPSGMELHAVLGDDLPPARPDRQLLLLPPRTLALLDAHRWPGNLRELAMTIENAATLALAEAIEAGRPPGVGPGQGRADVLQVRPKLMRDLLQATAPPGDADPGLDGVDRATVEIHPAADTRSASQELERQVYEQLFFRTGGDFSAMAGILLGDAEGALRVRNRFNALGLRATDLRPQLE